MSIIVLSKTLFAVLVLFSFSSQRPDLLKDFQAFAGTDGSKLLKHSPTRWLSLHRCLSRLIAEYEGVKAYFVSHNDAGKPRSKVGHINEILQHPTTLPWLMFVVNTLEPFSKFNATFQVFIMHYVFFITTLMHR